MNVDVEIHKKILANQIQYDIKKDYLYIIRWHLSQKCKVSFVVVMFLLYKFPVYSFMIQHLLNTLHSDPHHKSGYHPSPYS